MTKWPVVAKHGASQDERRHCRRERLPLFYMNDYSRLGLQVDAIQDACRVLAENHYGVVQEDSGCHVAFANAAAVQAAVALLNDRGVACDIVDLADHIYQG